MKVKAIVKASGRVIEVTIDNTLGFDVFIEEDNNGFQWHDYELEFIVSYEVFKRIWRTN